MCFDLRGSLAVVSSSLVLVLACSPAPRDEIADARRATAPAASAEPSGQPASEAAAEDTAAEHGRAAAAPGTSEGPAPEQPAGTHAAMPHGDHTAHFGGLVFMDRDLHFEVVAARTGQYEVHFSDEQRNHLPASTVSNAVIDVRRPDAAPEVLELRTDASNSRWIGTGRPVDDGRTVVRVSYEYGGQPYSIDVPFWTLDRSLPH